MKQDATIRINRFIGLSGTCSRREADKHIAAGRVFINGKKAADLGSKINPEKDIVTLDGREIKLEGGFRYIVFNKPKGYVVSRARQSAPSIYECNGLPDLPYVGRLDKDTTGLLLLTNDGDLCFRLTHPSYAVEKLYEAMVSRIPGPIELDHLRNGVQLEDGKTAPALVRIIDFIQKRVEVVLHEGRKRQIRRMFSVLGIDVIDLHRAKFGPFELNGLELGKWRNLEMNEVAKIRQSAGL